MVGTQTFKGVPSILGRWRADKLCSKTENLLPRLLFPSEARTNNTKTYSRVLFIGRPTPASIPDSQLPAADYQDFLNLALQRDPISPFC